MCLALPGLLLVLLLAAIAPDAPLMLWLGLSLVLWVEFFRVTRATLRPVVMSPAVQSSSLLGFSIVYLFRRHLWPALSPLLLTLTVYAFSNAIMAVSALGFISVGVRPPTPELGLMMTELFPMPGSALAITAACGCAVYPAGGAEFVGQQGAQMASIVIKQVAVFADTCILEPVSLEHPSRQARHLHW